MSSGHDDLAALQYDIAQRYGLLAAILDAVLPTPARILDVGAGPSDLTRRHLRSGYEIVAADVVVGDRTDLVCLQTGGALPYGDASFDAVIAMDVLEHVAPVLRDRFVAEMARVARHVVVLAFPRSAPAVTTAEAVLASVFENGTGTTHAFLAEHARNGLPDIAKVTIALRASGFDSQVHGNCALDEWQIYTTIDAMLAVAGGDTGAKDRFNRAINRPASTAAVESSYRVFVVGAADRARLQQLAALPRRADGEGIGLPEVMAVTAALAELQRLITEVRTAERATTAAALGDLRTVIAAKEHHITKLEALVQEVARAQAGARQNKGVDARSRRQEGG